MLTDPLTPFLQAQGVVILDGGFATELEARGCVIDDPIWSAKVLLEDPDLVRAVHYDYLASGADCICSASYQATIEGLTAKGLSESGAIDVLLNSVRLAIEARDEFWSQPERRVGRVRPVVAASIGPYGAFLADGSEYDGRYGLNVDELIGFHRERWHILANSGADLMACETIPSHVETRALLRLLAETPTITAWMSLSCRDAYQLHDGSRIKDVIAPLATASQIVAIGANCVPPSLVPGIVDAMKEMSDKPIVAYPNSGENYDAVTKRWFGVTEPTDFSAAASDWYDHGARVVGGCCRTGLRHVNAIRGALAG